MYQLAACLATQVTAWLKSIMMTPSIMEKLRYDRASCIQASPLTNSAVTLLIKSRRVCVAHVPLVLDSDLLVSWSGCGVAPYEW